MHESYDLAVFETGKKDRKKKKEKKEKNSKFVFERLPLFTYCLEQRKRFQVKRMIVNSRLKLMFNTCVIVR